jgi:hypothetical protein
MAFAEQLLLPGAMSELPKATWALTIGPGALDDPALATDNDKHVDVAPGKDDGFVARLMAGRIFSNASQTQEVEQIKDDALLQQAPIVFPLPTSDAQNRIADLLLRKHYPVIVTEGPPGMQFYPTMLEFITNWAELTLVSLQALARHILLQT